MDEEERPRKLQKLDLSMQDNSTGLNSSLQDATMDSSMDATTPHKSDVSAAPTAATDNMGKDADNTGSRKDSHSAPEPVPQLSMSKSQLKKERKKRKWEEGREERKAKRKVKQAEKRRRKYLEKDEESTAVASTLGGSIDTNVDHTSDAISSSAPPTSRRPFLTPITFILDCGFDELMLDREVVSLANQVTRSYSENRRSTFRTQLVVSSFSGRLRERFETVLAKSYMGWTAARFVEDDFVAAAEQARSTMVDKMGGWSLHGPLARASVGAGGTITASNSESAPAATDKTTEGEIIYLTSDSEHTLTHLTPYSTYIIGGIVDRNRHKGLCYKRALDHGIRTAKLPIGDYLDMTSRFVLATNHVVEIMHRWLECGDWAEAFSKVIPKRKGGVPKRRDGGVDGGVSVKNGEVREEQRGGESCVDEGVEEADGGTEEANHASIDEGRDPGNAAGEDIVRYEEDPDMSSQAATIPSKTNAVPG
ncbi:MAG: tRNA (guanine(9)-N(1))-methyltransferase [Trichoglossum hirsutum]|jgi:tRNA (guanine9-N1)-methyltransferase|nr:MAG: tRNA (guanine(9)-N(1))-methyltransferase [Trichoglossum hirsutum]